MTIQTFPEIRPKGARMVPTPLGDLSVRIMGHGPRRIVLWPSIMTDSHIFDVLADKLPAVLNQTMNSVARATMSYTT